MRTFHYSCNTALSLVLLLTFSSSAWAAPQPVTQTGFKTAEVQPVSGPLPRTVSGSTKASTIDSVKTNAAPVQAADPVNGSVPIQARAVYVLSLTDALNLMEKQNLQLSAARKNMDISRAGVKIANEIPNPQIQAYHYWGNIVALGTNEQLGISQQIETGGKRHKRVAAAQSQVALTQAQYNALLWDLRSQTRQAYVQLAAAKENIALLDAQSDLAKNLVYIANKRVEVGAAPISEVLQAQLAYSQIGTQQIQAVTQLKQAQGLLNALLGHPLMPEQEDSYDISDEGYFSGNAQKSELVPLPNAAVPDYNLLLKQAMDKRPDLIAALRQLQYNEDQLKLTQAQRTPDLFVSVGYPFLKLKQSVAPVNGQTYYQGIWAQVGFTVPVFHNQGPEIIQGQHQVDQSQLQVKAIQQQLVSDIYHAMQGLNGARDNIRLYRLNLLPSADEVLRVAQKSYQVGKTGLTNVIVAQQQTQQVRQGYIQSVLDYHKAWSDLEKAVGSRLDF